MNHPITRRGALSSLGAGAAGIAALSVFAPHVTLAAMSSSAGVVAGGSLEGPDGTIQFSAFGSRTQLDDVEDLILQGSLTWLDPTGFDGEALLLELVAVSSYGPGMEDTERVLTGTASVNGDGEHAFGLLLVDGGEIGTGTDTVRLVVGSAVAEITGTPVPAEEFAYDVAGSLITGNVQIVTLA